MQKNENLTIEQCKDPDIGYKLLNYLVSDFEPKIEIASEIRQRMKEKPDLTYCVVIKSGNVIVGFLFSYIIDSVAFIRQAHATLSLKRSKEIFNNFKVWVKDKGIGTIEITVKKKRLRDYYKRQYGFISVDEKTMKLEI